MELRIDLDSPVPPFEQIRAQITAYISSGQLAAGTKLPTVRALAGDLGVASGTVQRAYRELESAGLVEASGKRGTQVRTDIAPSQRAPDTHKLQQAVDDARRAGLTPQEILTLVAHRVSLPVQGDHSPS